MAKQIRLTPLAHQDIEGIYNYVIKDGVSIAQKQVSDIYKSIENLAAFPDIGIPLQKFVERKTEYKLLIIKKVYVAVYEVGDTVDILRVFRKDQDYIAQLGIDED